MRKRKLLLLTFVWILPIIILGETCASAAVHVPKNQNSSGDLHAQLPWEDLYEKKPPPREDPPGGGRGYVCAIAPAVAGKVGVIWSDRPLFLWQGNVGKIEVRPQGSQQALWSQTIAKEQNSATYEGEALQPGQSYDWVMFNERLAAIFRVTFQVMIEEERDRITSDLTDLQAQLKQEGATAEAIAYARADYLASRQLWADALQEVYGVENPSEELSQFKQAVPDKFCAK